MRINTKEILVTVIFVLFGFIVTAQIKTIWKENMEKNQNVLYNNEKLISAINEEKQQIEKLKKTIEQSESFKDQILKEAIAKNNNSKLESNKNIFDDVMLKAGLTKVSGKGVVITMDDAVPAQIGINPNDLVIHDVDVLRVVNGLKSSGAQAISINGERLIATSELVCAGPTIRINKRRYSVPFEIKAIGNPENLYQGLTKNEAVILMMRDGIRININKSNSLELPAYSYDIKSLISGLEEVSK